MNPQSTLVPMLFLGGVAYLIFRSLPASEGGGGNGAGGANGGASSDGGAGGGSGASGSNNTTGEGGRGSSGSAGGGAPVAINEANIMKAASDKVFAATFPASFTLKADEWNYHRAKALNADPVAKDLWPADKPRDTPLTAVQWHAQLAAHGLSGMGSYYNYQVTPGRRSHGVYF